ncbi:hypothetical protein NEOLEDRAFT_1118963, partial [Neolentinus lepideus HHB14362 ss-1]
GFFLQDSPAADPARIGPLPPRFGLLDDSPDRWTAFRDAIAGLNDAADEGTQYKAFLLARHGEGWHNVAEAKYGTKAWDDYWSKLNGDGEITWGQNLREHYGEHTCDKRRTRSALALSFPLPTLNFEEGFTEDDELWTEERESAAHVAERARAVLDGIFKAEDEWLVSITSHSGFINGLLAAVGRARYALPTGGILPLVIKRTTSAV